MIINTEQINDALNHSTFAFDTMVKVRSDPYIDDSTDTGLVYEAGMSVNYSWCCIVADNNYLWLYYTSAIGNYPRYIACGVFKDNEFIPYGRFI